MGDNMVIKFMTNSAGIRITNPMLPKTKVWVKCWFCAKVAIASPIHQRSQSLHLQKFFKG